MSLAKLLATVKKMESLTVAYGIDAADGVKIKPLEEGPDPINVATAAAINEFNIGPRPAFRRTFTDRKADLAKGIGKAIKDGLRKESGAALMLDIGSVGADLIADNIRTSPTWAKPNAAETIAKKGFDHPLIETTQELNLISAVVTSKSGGIVSKRSAR